jgi:exodeoxyribonuclease V gamma subunit
MFHLTQSNRFEFLLESLLANLEAEAPGPFDVQPVIVPSAAVRRRIELAQAERLGVCANLEFAFLARWLWRQIGRVVPVAESSPFAPPVLAWRLHEILADPALAAAHPPLGAYLAAADATMRFDLAQALARVFDHYLTYRPEWLAAWAAGRPAGLKDECRADEAWQAELWRRVAAGLGAVREHPMSAFFAAAEAHGAVSGLPRSAHLFCLPTLPPLYLDVLRRLSRWMDLHLYVLNPCREYWFEIVDRKRLAYLAARQGDLYHEVGNSLLAAWGRQAKAQLELLFDDAGLIQDQGSAFRPAGGKTLLARLHDAILDLTELDPGSLALASSDRSVEVHVCHSLTRELEVLHDQLLALFAGPRPPRPADIVVLTPDLDAAAPLIEAVLGTAPAGRRIPFVITGRGAVGTNPVLRAVDALLATVGSRCTASQVLDLLHLPPIARRFGLAPDDLPRIHAWLGEAGIRWGMDEATPEALGLPAGGHSFAAGLDRLFLAYALGDEEPDATELFVGRLPAGNPEGGAALTLGAWWRLVEALRALDRALSRPLDADAWRAALLNLAADFIAEEREWADELRSLNAAIVELHAQMVAGGAASPQPLAVIRTALAALLDEPARGGTPSGAVTFSALTTLRHLPYRVVCLIGMNHGAFPGAARPAEFDLLARHPKPGDRQRRDDERNLFLDAVLAARERLYLSYTGRSIRDASPLPASVLVDELLDYLAAATASDPADPKTLAAARRRLVVEHPLQAFSPAYFLPGEEGGENRDPRLVSFNAEYCAALRARQAAPPPVDLPAVEDDEDDEDSSTDQPFVARPFFPASLPSPGEEWRAPGLDDLLRFFRNPCQFLLTRRLGLRLEEGEESPADEEPFLADWPVRQALARRLLPAALAGRDPDALLQLAQAGGEYPAGRLGEAELRRELASLARYAARLAPALAEPLAPPLVARLDFEIDGEAWSLEGALSDLRPAGLVRARYDEARATDYLEAWLAHLFLCAASPGGVASRTVWHARDCAFALQPCETPCEHLAELLALYRRGLTEPLPFFPKSACAYVTEGGSIVAAHKVWHNSRNPEHGESAKAAYRLALRGRADPLDADFEAVARTVFGPLLEHLEGAA